MSEDAAPLLGSSNPNKNNGIGGYQRVRERAVAGASNCPCTQLRIAEYQPISSNTERGKGNKFE